MQLITIVLFLFTIITFYKITRLISYTMESTFDSDTDELLKKKNPYADYEESMRKLEESRRELEAAKQEEKEAKALFEKAVKERTLLSNVKKAIDTKASKLASSGDDYYDFLHDGVSMEAYYGMAGAKVDTALEREGFAVVRKILPNGEFGYDLWFPDEKNPIQGGLPATLAMKLVRLAALTNSKENVIEESEVMEEKERIRI